MAFACLCALTKVEFIVRDAPTQCSTKRNMKTFSGQSSLSNVLCCVVLGLFKDKLALKISCVLGHHVKSWVRPVRRGGNSTSTQTFCQYSHQSHVTTKHTYNQHGKTIFVINLQTTS